MSQTNKYLVAGSKPLEEALYILGFHPTHKDRLITTYTSTSRPHKTIKVSDAAISLWLKDKEGIQRLYYSELTISEELLKFYTTRDLKATTYE